MTSSLLSAAVLLVIEHLHLVFSNHFLPQNIEIVRGCSSLFAAPHTLNNGRVDVQRLGNDMYLVVAHDRPVSLEQQEVRVDRHEHINRVGQQLVEGVNAEWHPELQELVDQLNVLLARLGPIQPRHLRCGHKTFRQLVLDQMLHEVSVHLLQR